ncbi:mRNA-processing factor 19 [Seminavis robusta]|uniref:Pre-mRNA-processing factor 19 n=1 Tax=Seminavis robusta TaxID=568900 RepID=A0A9N8HKP8_9STRA|nr:mRNA-processing factor 19 [Seminavis robusta]|eukprot:Sro627_g177960.1 mRNA-processing factor 19 (515) ;mRNA; r:53941-55578
MSLRCAISGEPISLDNAGDVVVTPSGHVCLKRLLLTKLSENGGVDPFSDGGRPLSEDELVTLAASGKNQGDVPPPPPSRISSFSGTLQQLAKEYDAVLLELFDTRKVLQDTRRELSQALYQNDAALRVVARISMERDAARQESQRFQAAAAASTGSSSAEDNGGAAPRKKARVETQELPLTNDIPTADLDTMLTEWEKLHKARRAKPKTTYSLPASWKVADSPSYHKSTCKGLTAVASSDSNIVTAGKDKQIMVYDTEKKSVGATFHPKCVVASLDAMPNDGSVWVVAACGQEARIYNSASEEVHASCNVGDTVVEVSGHPTNKHCCAVTKGGKLLLFRIGEKDMEHVSTFSSDQSMEYACGGMHPDGLLFAVGTTNGKIELWDLKNKNIGANLSVDNDDGVTKLAFSSSGYHFASAHQSGAVRVWDLRKNKILAELNVSGDQLLQSVTGIAFHPDGKYLAYGGTGGLHIVMLKEWKVTPIPDVKVASGIVWDSQWIASISSEARAVTFHTGGD